MLAELRKHNKEMFASGGLGIGTAEQPPVRYFTNQVIDRANQLDALVQDKAPAEQIHSMIGQVTMSLDLLTQRLGGECSLEKCIHQGYEDSAKKFHFTKKRSLRNVKEGKDKE